MWLVGIPLIAYLAVLSSLYVFQRQLLYFPDKSRPQLADLAQLGVREIGLTTADRLSLFSWYLPPLDGRPVIFYLHGNGGNIGYRGDRMRRFAREGYGVLMLEYRGYGGNPGTPTEAGLYDDARAGLEFLQREGITADRLVLYGESLGSGVAVHLAARRPVAALILESPFTSVAAVAQYHYPYVPAALMIWDRYDSLSRIGRVSAPILILRGERDAVVPAPFSEALFDAAPEPKEGWSAPDAGHVNLDGFGALEIVVAFIERRTG
ncbi:MAG TPA: alpha/beta hydrolase [Stellaceae bacterium]